ncbi:MAG: hypothetical protein AB7K24_24910 [Gemmataceae bacterium]
MTLLLKATLAMAFLFSAGGDAASTKVESVSVSSPEHFWPWLEDFHATEPEPVETSRHFWPWMEDLHSPSSADGQAGTEQESTSQLARHNDTQHFWPWLAELKTRQDEQGQMPAASVRAAYLGK